MYLKSYSVTFDVMTDEMPEPMSLLSDVVAIGWKYSVTLTRVVLGNFLKTEWANIPQFSPEFRRLFSCSKFSQLLMGIGTLASPTPTQCSFCTFSSVHTKENHVAAATAVRSETAAETASLLSFGTDRGTAVFDQ
jgi:hypothetical protein